MGARMATEAPVIARAYPWGALGHVVDVGGGNASLLIALLHAHDALRGTALDLPGPIARAEHALAATDLGDHAGSFFDPLPAGAGGYVLSGVLHDWPDEDALRILRRCADAVPPTGKVLVVGNPHRIRPAPPRRPSCRDR
ncbi:methyltransferase [Nocardia sp. BMG51109]|uniref:methyltransferase n=1 Tax=Nocardia sp. BMG51109 TaxID=1056816 RepID=UPI0004B6C8FD|nr:methyltransferase [Nocardia sp. BMG51109]